MFTGLIETTGAIVSVERKGAGSLIAIKPESADFKALPGASVAIDGACLTVETVKGPVLYFTAVKETLDRTTLGRARPGGRVNLERALPASGRFDGHLVLGHVDGMGAIVSLSQESNDWRCTVEVPENCRRFMAEKGSIAIDGISLTIAEVNDAAVTLALVPTTLQATTMKQKRPKDVVNIECDVIARYVSRLLSRDTDDAEKTDGETLYKRMEGAGF
ncbi:MAG: riboflavin synthase [Chitinispirillaceae bacterium]|jgi:riboflavin synthase